MDTEQTPTPRPSPLRDDTDARLPAAAFLRYEARADGWSAGRQSAFLAHLADHGVVEDAARSVGMSLGGGYALRRQARGYAFNLGWEAALIIARRVVADNLMTAAIKGEQSRWVREDGVTTYIRQNTKLSMTLLDRVNPAISLAEVLAMATRFDWFLQLIDDGVAAEQLWELFFEDALAHDDIEARGRVRASLLLCDDLAGLDDGGAVKDGDSDDHRTDGAATEYKSVDGPVHSEEDAPACAGPARTEKTAGVSPGGFRTADANPLDFMASLETNAHANDGLMAVKIGVDVEIILTDVDILVVRIAIFGLDKARWAEQVELLFNASTDAVTVGGDAVVEDRAGTIIETAFKLGVGIAALAVDHGRWRYRKADARADIQIAVGVQAEAVAGGDQVLTRALDIGVGIFALDTGNDAAELKVITGVDAVHQVAVAFADVVITDNGFDVRAGEWC
jgi:hypothetical protein